MSSLYPEISPYQSDTLTVSATHNIYYEQSGNPNGAPVLFLHGGPGSGCNPAQRRFFNPTFYRIIIFDQRGCGRSSPQGETHENTTQDLIADIEKLRTHLQIDRWHIFGGSWGSSLALAYALEHTQNVISLVLRGIFLSRPSELNWFLGDIAHFYPDAWQKLVEFLPQAEQSQILNGFEKRIFADDMQVAIPAAIAWNAYETSIMRLLPSAESSPTSKTADELHKEHLTEVARARVQIHYIKHACFIDGEAMLREAAMKLAHIPTYIVQGRYDMVCPPQTAWRLKLAMPHAQFTMVPDAGHSAMETGVTAALIEATNAISKLAV